MDAAIPAKMAVQEEGLARKRYGAGCDGYGEYNQADADQS
jgi:hypothetical protein